MNNVHKTQYSVYKEGEENIDPYSCIVDTGCPRTVTGRIWMEMFLESQGDNIKVRTGKENENFRFGPSKI